MKVMVTGANGFLGRSLVAASATAGLEVCAIARTDFIAPMGVIVRSVGSIDGATAWSDALLGCGVVCHLAARVHVVNDMAVRPLDEFRHVNVHGTINLARQAAASGVTRFIYVSSIGVNGAETFGKPFTAQDLAAPHSPYAVSKYEAEVELRKLSLETGMEVVVVRPPLVYGNNAPGNFGALTRWVQRGLPLPLGAIHNKRSFVSIDNLTSLLLRCATHPNAANQTFLVSDGHDVSTTELLINLGHALGCPARLLPLPTGLLKAAGYVMGKREAVQRLCGSLQIDISKTRQMLDWSPPFTVKQGLMKVAMEEMHEAHI